MERFSKGKTGNISPKKQIMEPTITDHRLTKWKKKNTDYNSRCKRINSLLQLELEWQQTSSMQMKENFGSYVAIHLFKGKRPEPNTMNGITMKTLIFGKTYVDDKTEGRKEVTRIWAEL